MRILYLFRRIDAWANGGKWLSEMSNMDFYFLLFLNSDHVFCRLEISSIPTTTSGFSFFYLTWASGVFFNWKKCCTMFSVHSSDIHGCNLLWLCTESQIEKVFQRRKNCKWLTESPLSLDLNTNDLASHIDAIRIEKKKKKLLKFIFTVLRFSSLCEKIQSSFCEHRIHCLSMAHRGNNGTEGKSYQ